MSVIPIILSCYNFCIRPRGPSFSDVKMQSLPHLLFGERDYGVLKARKAKYQEERKKNISLLSHPLPFKYT